MANTFLVTSTSEKVALSPSSLVGFFCFLAPPIGPQNFVFFFYLFILVSVFAFVDPGPGVFFV